MRVRCGDRTSASVFDADGVLPLTSRRTKAHALRSVLANLLDILQSQPGYGTVLPDYGLASLEQRMPDEEQLAALLLELRALITAYEPRLALEQVRSLPGEPGAELRVALEGRIDGEPTLIEVRLQPRVGRLDVVAA